MDTTMNPRQKVRFWTLIGLCYLTLSPLIALVNRRQGRPLSPRAVKWLIICSPMVWSLVCFALFAVALPLISASMPSVANSLRAWPEFTNVTSGDFRQIFLVVYFLPLYAFCVLVLFVAMALTGWSYREASVYVCEYFAPWFCVAVAAIIVLWILTRMRRLTLTGRLWSLVPMAMELALISYNVNVYQQRAALYAGWSIDRIFNHVVNMLITLGQRTSTNYITANMIIYLLPLAAILLTALLAHLIATLTPSKSNAI